jgi:hypothetical protein
VCCGSLSYVFCLPTVKYVTDLFNKSREYLFLIRKLKNHGVDKVSQFLILYTLIFLILALDIIPVSECMELTDEGATYQLQQDISVNVIQTAINNYCFQISAPSITLNGGGYSIVQTSITNSVVDFGYGMVFIFLLLISTSTHVSDFPYYLLLCARIFLTRLTFTLLLLS